MSKNIIFCADGTWNGPGEVDEAGNPVHSNVQMLFESLAGSAALKPQDNEKECTFTDASGTAAQAAKYIHGVGSTTNPLVRFAEGSTGAGLVARVVRGYTYLSRTYRPGDRIYLIGFSRGAYTARALAGFIAHCGLLDWQAMGLTQGDNKSYAAGIAAWQAYQKTRHNGDNGILDHLSTFITDAAVNFSQLFNAPPALKYVVDVPIKAVGVWDTVGALGVPQYNVEDDTRLDVFQFIDAALHPSIERGYHAIAIDEQRADFTPSVWADRAQGGILQVLFPGAHADVGGGYPSLNHERELSDGAFQWMLDQMTSIGVRFGMIAPHKPNPLGVAHQPWLKAPYDVLPTLHRHFGPGLSLSQMAVDRASADPVLVQGVANAIYRPPNLANSYFVLTTGVPAPHVDVAPLNIR